jgi:hypothetical protein
LNQEFWEGILSQKLAIRHLFCTELILCVLTGIANFCEDVLQLVHSSQFDFKVRTFELLERDLTLQNITYLTWLDTRIVSPWKAFVTVDGSLNYFSISLLQLYVLNILKSIFKALSNTVWYLLSLVLLQKSMYVFKLSQNSCNNKER